MRPDAGNRTAADGGARGGSRPVIVLLLVLLAGGVAPAASAGPVDPHALFEARCGRCHGHAGAFARQAMTLDGEVLVGRRSGVPVERFLGGHYGALSRAENRRLIEMFRLQVIRGALFQERCRICHGSARRLARGKLILREGRLVGRYTGADIAAFMGRHGRLTPEQLATILAMLEWQVSE